MKSGFIDFCLFFDCWHIPVTVDNKRKIEISVFIFFILRVGDKKLTNFELFDCSPIKDYTNGSLRMKNDG